MRVQSLRNRKGWLEIVEVTIVGLLIFYNLGQLASQAKYSPSQWEDSVRMRRLAEDTLIVLDSIPREKTTLLRDDLNKRNYTDLATITKDYIPYPYAYSYEITYPNETYASRKPPKGSSEATNYIIFDTYGGKPVKYSVMLRVWSLG